MHVFILTHLLSNPIFFLNSKKVNFTFMYLSMCFLLCGIMFENLYSHFHLSFLIKKIKVQMCFTFFQSKSELLYHDLGPNVQLNYLKYTILTFVIFKSKITN